MRGGNVSNTVRTPGLLGRRAAQFPEGLHDLTYYSAGPLPKAPASVPVPAVPDWGMQGNDTKGDCGPAGLVHGFMSAAADAGEHETFPGAAQTVEYYLKYTNGQDTGVVLSQYLAYVRQQGFYGHTVKAFAPVSVHDVPTLQSAIYLYDFAYCGIVVTQAMQEAFANGQPWTAEMLNSPVLGGHCVPAVAYSDEYLTIVTWGSTQQIAWPAWHAMSSEAWAVLPGELAEGDGHGVNLAALEADLDRLDVPAPTAAAAVQGGLLGELAALIRDVHATEQKDVTELLAFLASHGL